MNPREIAETIECERFKRYGVGQEQMRIACEIVVSAIEGCEQRRPRRFWLWRFEARSVSDVLQALRLYGKLRCHVDREAVR